MAFSIIIYTYIKQNISIYIKQNEHNKLKRNFFNKILQYCQLASPVIKIKKFYVSVSFCLFEKKLFSLFFNFFRKLYTVLYFYIYLNIKYYFFFNGYSKLQQFGDRLLRVMHMPLDNSTNNCQAFFPIKLEDCFICN